MTLTKVCQHTFCWNAAAKIFLQVVRSVQQCLELLCKHFVAGFGLNLRQEKMHESPNSFNFYTKLVALI